MLYEKNKACESLQQSLYQISATGNRPGKTNQKHSQILLKSSISFTFKEFK